MTTSKRSESPTRGAIRRGLRGSGPISRAVRRATGQAIRSGSIPPGHIPYAALAGTLAELVDDLALGSSPEAVIRSSQQLMSLLDRLELAGPDRPAARGEDTPSDDNLDQQLAELLASEAEVRDPEDP